MSSCFMGIQLLRPQSWPPNNRWVRNPMDAYGRMVGGYVSPFRNHEFLGKSADVAESPWLLWFPVVAHTNAPHLWKSIREHTGKRAWVKAVAVAGWKVISFWVGSTHPKNMIFWDGSGNEWNMIKHDETWFTWLNMATDNGSTWRYPKIHGLGFCSRNIDLMHEDQCDWWLILKRLSWLQVAGWGKNLAVSSQFSLPLFTMSINGSTAFFVRWKPSFFRNSWFSTVHPWNLCVFLAANHQFCPCSIPGPQDSNLLVPLEVEFKCPLYLNLGFGIEHGTNLGFIKFNLKYYCIHSRFDKSGQFHPETSPRNLPETSLPALPSIKICTRMETWHWPS